MEFKVAQAYYPKNTKMKENIFYFTYQEEIQLKMHKLINI